MAQQSRRGRPPAVADAIAEIELRLLAVGERLLLVLLGEVACGIDVFVAAGHAGRYPLFAGDAGAAWIKKARSVMVNNSTVFANTPFLSVKAC